MTRKNHFLFIALLLFFTGFGNRQLMAQKIAPQKKALKANPTFLFLSDIHLNSFAGQVSYNSDTGMDLWQQFLQKAGAILSGNNAPQFILYTGDLPSHNNCKSPCELHPGTPASNVNDSNISAILTGLRRLSENYKKPLFYLPGNNDGLSGDYYSFSDSSGHTPFFLVPDSSNPYPALNTAGTGKVPGMITGNAAMGYYAARPVAGLRLICLNTVMYTHGFTVADGSNKEADRADQMTWLGDQLAEAVRMQEKVYIAMHVPPGTDAFSGNPMWDTQPVNWLPFFLSLTTKYQSSIAGIFYGHTHMDEMRRLYDSTGKQVTEVAISCPGVSPLFSNNPGFKVITYNPASKEVMDFTTYYTKPTANSWGSNVYSFNSVFGGDTSKTIYDRLKQMQLPILAKRIAGIYMVNHGTGSVATVQSGVEVK